MLLVVQAAACAVAPSRGTPSRETQGPAEIRLAPQTVLRLPEGLVYVPAEPGDPDMLGVVLDRSFPAAKRLVLFAASRDARGVPRVEAAGWR